MKRTKGMVLIVLALGMLTACGRSSLKETGVSVGKDGVLTAEVFDTLDQSYYNAEELKANVESSVADYNRGAGEDTITVEKFEIGEEGEVELSMKYASSKDYMAFNNVDFYAGDITDGYNSEGYRFETTFRQVEKGEIVGDEIKREDIFAGSNHPMIAFSEPMMVEVPGKILYVSSNVEVTGKKTARMAGSAPAEETEPESETSGEGEDVQEVDPMVESIGNTDDDVTLAYIIYE